MLASVHQGNKLPHLLTVLTASSQVTPLYVSIKDEGSTPTLEIVESPEITSPPKGHVCDLMPFSEDLVPDNSPQSCYQRHQLAFPQTARRDTRTNLHLRPRRPNLTRRLRHNPPSIQRDHLFQRRKLRRRARWAYLALRNPISRPRCEYP